MPHRTSIPDWLKDAKSVGLSAGASAPEVLVTEVVAYLKRLGSSEEVEELTVIEEDVEFLLPKELVTIESASIVPRPRRTRFAERRSSPA